MPDRKAHKFKRAAAMLPAAVGAVLGATCGIVLSRTVSTGAEDSSVSTQVQRRIVIAGAILGALLAEMIIRLVRLARKSNPRVVRAVIAVGLLVGVVGLIWCGLTIVRPWAANYLHVRVLARQLQSPHESVREVAALELMGLGPNARSAVPALVQALNDHDTLVRQIAAGALGEIAAYAEPAVPALVNALGDPLVKHEAAIALAKIGPAAIPRLIAAVESGDPEVCEAAAMALGRMKSPEAFRPLTTLLDHERHEVRASAASAIGLMKAYRTIATRDLDVAVLIKMLIAAEDDLTRREAIGALYNAHTTSALNNLNWDLNDYADAFIGLLKHKEPDVRVAGAEMLARTPAAHAKAVLHLADLLDDDAAEVRYRVAMVLGNIGLQTKDDRLVPALCKALRDPDPVVRAIAASTCWNLVRNRGRDYLSFDPAIPILRELALDPDARVTQQASQALKLIVPEDLEGGLEANEK